MDLVVEPTYGYDIRFNRNDFVNTPKDVPRKVQTMSLIARFFALTLVVTGAVASTQIHASNAKPVVGAGMSMMPAAGCDPNSGGCGMSGQ